MQANKFLVTLSHRLSVLLLSFVTTIIFLQPCAAQEQRQNLFGDALGARTALADRGIEVESILTVDYVAGVDGGIETDDTLLGNYDFTATVDTEKFGLWKNGTVFLYVLGDFNSGTLPTEIVGDLQASDNIEADEAIKLYEAWYEHSFADDSLGVLVGLHDYNSEFYALDYASGLINSSFGVGPDVSQVGPSIFATTALAARVRYAFLENAYVLAALYDGVPGNPNNPRGTHIRLGGDDGLFYAGELGVVGSEDDYYKLALGVWHHTATFEDFSATQQDKNGGLYLIGEKRLLSETDTAQGLGVFAQIGSARESRNLIGTYLGGGLSYTGLLPSRDEDVFSFGLARALISTDAAQLDDTLDSSETAIELNYRMLLTPYIALAPDFQWISTPGGVRGAQDATVLALRAEVAM